MMEYSLEEKKKYGFGMDFMMIGLALLIILIIFGVYFMMQKNND
jgi:Tfp pilus assembly protein FimT